MHNSSKAIPLFALGLLIIILPPVSSLTNLSVTVSINKTQYSTGETVSISGVVRDSQNNPVFGAGVSIQVNDPGGKFLHVNIVFTDQAGAYSDHFIVPSNSALGQYTVFITASKSGYNNAQNQAQFVVSSTATTSSSQTTSTSHTISSSTSSPGPPKCLIATATYGSELSPEVSLLRNFRDNDILKTRAGTYFILAFNAFYYSFSPHVASYISSNNYLRAVTKAILYPVVGTLYISNLVFAALSFNGELAVTLAGMFASISLGAVYVGPVIAAISHFFKKSRSSRFTRPVLITFAMITVSLIGLSLAEAVQSAALLMASTAATVLSCVALGSVLVPWILARPRK